MWCVCVVYGSQLACAFCYTLKFHISVFFNFSFLFFSQKANWQENATILRNTEKPLRGYTVGDWAHVPILVAAVVVVVDAVLAFIWKEPSGDGELD